MNRHATHPFADGADTRHVTRQHCALIWGGILGTVYARNAADPEGDPVYCDYDYDKARRVAGVAACTDLRTCRVRFAYQGGPAKGRMALYGIPLVPTRWWSDIVKQPSL